MGTKIGMFLLRQKIKKFRPEKKFRGPEKEKESVQNDFRRFQKNKPFRFIDDLALKVFFYTFFSFSCWPEDQEGSAVTSCQCRINLKLQQLFMVSYYSLIYSLFIIYLSSLFAMEDIKLLF